jgi:hypothetical protein
MLPEKPKSPFELITCNRVCDKNRCLTSSVICWGKEGLVWAAWFSKFSTETVFAASGIEMPDKLTLQPVNSKHRTVQVKKPFMGIRHFIFGASGSWFKGKEY